jgi:hypothetical protein
MAPDGRGFDSRWCLEFFIDIILPAALWPWVHSTFNRNEYQEYFLGGKGSRFVGLTTLAPSSAECIEIGERRHPGTLRPAQELLYLYAATHGNDTFAGNKIQ